LKERADLAYLQFQRGTPISNATRQPELENDELALFGGQTQVIVSKLLSSRLPKGTQSRSASKSPPAQDNWESDSTFASAEQIPDVHPSLVEYVSMFPSEYIDNGSTISQPTNFNQQQVIATLSTHQTPTMQEKENTQNSWSTSSNFTDSTSLPSYSSSSFPAIFTPELQSGIGPIKSKEGFYGGNVFELGMMTSDTGMDDPWTSFMRDTGLLDGGLIGSGLYGAGETMPLI
jgi:hypothetical protein